MKKRTSFKYKYLYIFILTLSFIGVVSGYHYYKIQDDTVKNDVISKVNLKDDLNKRTNNIGKRFKKVFIILVFSILVLPCVINVLYIFYDFFSLGFIFCLMKQFGFKFACLYNLLYLLIPLIFNIILIRIGFSLAKQIVLIVYDRKNISLRSRVRVLLKKYLLIIILFILYEVLIWLFSTGLNSYLLSILK